MKTPGFLGLPEKVQTIVLEGLDEEIKNAKAHAQEVEKSNPVDADLLQSLRKDAERADSLRTRMTSGQA